MSEKMDDFRNRWENYKSNSRKFDRKESCMQWHLYIHFNSPVHRGFLNDVSVTLIDNFSCRDWLYDFFLVLMCLRLSGCFTWNIVKCKSHFTVFGDTFLYFSLFSNSLDFFYRHWIFLRYKDDFCYLGLMLVCFTMGGGLERFLRSRYHIFSRVTIHVTTLVIILLWTFCILPNAILFLDHYYISYCMLYFTFSVK